MAQRIFHEPEPGRVAHTHASALLAENAAVRDYVGTVCAEIWPAATKLADAVEKWPAGRGREESGYVLAHGRTLKQTLEAEPGKRLRHDRALGAFSNDRSFSMQHLVHGFDWAGLGEGAVVVDVGGGIGSASRALAKAFPRLRLVVQDREEVVRGAVVEDEEKIQFLAHDFFQEQPVKGADVYFFRRVMMEWTDEKAVEIVKALRPALKKGALVQIQDPYVPPPGSCPIWQERKYRDSDMLAMSLGSGGSREDGEWKRIFDLAGPGFDFKGVRTVPGSNIAFIEAVWQGDDVSEPVPEPDGGAEEKGSGI